MLLFWCLLHQLQRLEQLLTFASTSNNVSFSPYFWLSFSMFVCSETWFCSSLSVWACSWVFLSVFKFLFQQEKNEHALLPLPLFVSSGNCEGQKLLGIHYWLRAMCEETTITEIDGRRKLTGKSAMTQENVWWVCLITVPASRREWRMLVIVNPFWGRGTKGRSTIGNIAAERQNEERERRKKQTRQTRKEAEQSSKCKKSKEGKRQWQTIERIVNHERNNQGGRKCLLRTNQTHSFWLIAWQRSAVQEEKAQRLLISGTP